MKRVFCFLLTLGVCVVLLGSVSLAKEEYVMKYSWNTQADPMKTSSTAQAWVFKQEVERLSGGRIKVELYPAGQLGDQRSATEQVKRGTIEVTDIASGVLASMYYEPLSIFDLPYVFSSREVAKRVLDTNNPFTQKIIEDCAKKTGIRILGLEPFGFRHFTNNVRPIKSPEDLNGLKIRVMETVPHTEMVKALGASPVPVPFMEVYTSLETGVIDGQENPASLILSESFHEVQKYMSLDGHLLAVGAILINEEWYQSLPEDLQQALYHGSRNAMNTYNGFGGLLDVIAIEELREKGMKIYALSPEEKRAFQKVARPPVEKWMREKIGDQVVDEFLDAVEKAEQKLVEETF